MQGKTHRIGGVLCAMVGFTVLEKNNLLLSNVNPLLQLIVMYPFAMYGSIVSDLDHSWDSAPSKDPISWGINKALHLTNKISDSSDSTPSLKNVLNAKHRSWQTHSDLFLILFIGLSIYLGSKCTGVDGVILRLISFGFILGVVSHLLLDMLTPEGIWCVVPSIIKHRRVSISFVPKSRFFATGGPWEKLVQNIMWFIVLIFTAYACYLISPYRIHINY